ncbi:MAG TPA: peptidase S8 [Cyanobacteria bacterium UBA8803]|nr:peptidase S8 [Cyanobacteria bacterium UBA9273]HBL59537.1 peptidase S8 [Cyanobacteria bacterium UBA8803]
MTRSPNPVPEDSPQSSGIPETSVGLLLQRGGEELALVKVGDRFTVHPTSPEVAAEVEQALPAQCHRRIPRTQLIEFTVAPEQRDEAMQAAREHEGVAFASHVYQLRDNPQTLVYVSDQLTVQFIPEADEESIRAIAAECGLQLVKPVAGIPNTFVLQLTRDAEENPVKIANRLMGRNEVVIAEPEIAIPQQPSYRPKDSLYYQQWYLNHSGGSLLAPGSHIDVEKAWDITKGNRSIVVAIADDAIDLNHPDFQGPGKIVAPKDFKDQDLLPLPASSDESHGTACAGIAVAEENGKGIVGVAPGCALMPIRTSGFLDDDSIEQLFDWAIQNNASVISCSWGPAAVYFPLSLRQRAALTRAATTGRQGKGCVVVFAAGNANRPVSGTVFERNWPDNLLRGPTNWLGGFTVHPDVITVSACTSLGKKSAYSNWGTNVSVCAPSNNAPPGMWFEKTGYIATAPEVNVDTPGLGMFSADLLGTLGYDTGDFVSNFGGTSSACPVVAGVAALVLSANPDLTAQEVKRILQDSADKIVDRDSDPQLGMRLGTYDTNGYSQWFGYGKVNAFKAVQAAQQLKVKATPAAQVLKKRNDMSLAIPDDNPNGITSVIRITESASVQEIQVSVNIEHNFLGDLEVTLKSPNGQSVLLQNRTLGVKTQLSKTYSLETTPALKQLLNQSAAGVWQLQVVDCSPTDTGTLKSWELILGV